MRRCRAPVFSSRLALVPDTSPNLPSEPRTPRSRPQRSGVLTSTLSTVAVTETIKQGIGRLFGRSSEKAGAELDYWRGRYADEEGSLGNAHFAALVTEQFDLDRSFFSGKRILDIGCGPRGSLEWATDASRRVGIDPLVEAYREFGIDAHAMEYFAYPVEHLGFDDASFDVVSSLNSLDHVDNLDEALSEITRVLVPGGSFLLEVEFGHRPTPAEPIEIPADFAESLAPTFTLISCERYGLADHQVHMAHAEKIPYRASRRRRPGVLIAHLVKQTAV